MYIIIVRFECGFLCTNWGVVGLGVVTDSTKKMQRASASSECMCGYSKELEESSSQKRCCCEEIELEETSRLALSPPEKLDPRVPSLGVLANVYFEQTVNQWSQYRRVVTH